MFMIGKADYKLTTWSADQFALWLQKPDQTWQIQRDTEARGYYGISILIPQGVKMCSQNLYKIYVWNLYTEQKTRTKYHSKTVVGLMGPQSMKIYAQRL